MHTHKDSKCNIDFSYFFPSYFSLVSELAHLSSDLGSGTKLKQLK